MDRSKILKMVVVLAAITIIAGSLTRMASHNSMSIAEYASLHSSDSPSDGPQEPETDVSDVSPSSGQEPDAASDQTTDGSSGQTPPPAASQTPGQPGENAPEDTSASESAAPETPPSATLTGAALNGTSQLESRIEWAEQFYYETISDALRRYMTGISYPATEGEDSTPDPAITFEELRYVHILYNNFEGEVSQGELVCNAAIAQDLVEIFYELYCNGYQLEKVLLIDEYDGDDNASMEDNNTSCFNYRVIEGTTRLSRHAYGLAVDVNPLYNPYITYEKDGTEVIAPAAALSYADRSARFAYKIDEDDLCYKLFIEHGFTWGGNWNSSKDYQHFQKNLE